MPHLQLSGISQAFRRADGSFHRVLDACSLAFERGEFEEAIRYMRARKSTAAK